MIHTIQNVPVIPGSTGISAVAYPCLGYERVTQIDFSGPKPMKQVILVPVGEQAPPHLRSENVVTYRVPSGTEVTEVVIGQGEVSGVKITMAQIFFTAGGELRHHDHLV